jgi:hypothetical protein
MPGLLQPQYRKRLVDLLGMLGSDFDGERANAARLADEHRKKCGLGWGELILPAPDSEALKPARPRKPRKPRKAKARKPPPEPPPPPTWRDMAELVAESVLATEWERTFAAGLLEKWCGPLTEKQDAVLQRLWLKCGGNAEKAA